MPCLLCASLWLSSACAATTETIVFIRHGEKPAAGLGQLDCQGLNRALALPPVLRRMFGRPDALFAPDPAARKPDHGVSYDYIRPLATIEPAAIAFGLPVNTRFPSTDTAGLATALQAPALHAALVVVAWEHRGIVAITRALLTASGGPANTVPNWAQDDFDGIYVLHITWDAARGSIGFERRSEGLDGRSAACPGM